MTYFGILSQHLPEGLGASTRNLAIVVPESRSKAGTSRSQRKDTIHSTATFGNKILQVAMIGVLGFDFRRGAENFSLHHRVQNGSGTTQPPIQFVPGALSLGVKRPKREADHSPPYSAEVKNVWSYTSTPQYAFMVRCLVKHRDNFTFTFYSTIAVLRRMYEGVSKSFRTESIKKYMLTFFTTR
jgi:hypothetical protein